MSAADTKPIPWAPRRGQGPSFWQFLRVQLGVRSSPGEELIAEQTAEAITDFLRTPYHLEQYLYVGLFLCLDSFLFIFTFLPLRMALAIPKLMINVLLGRRPALGATQLCDLLRGGVVIIVCLLLQCIDASRLYHLIRNQDTIKLYVVFNLLEIFDKYCAWLGQDILDALFARHHAKRMFFLAVVYTFIHSLINFCQVMTLNVAINSYSTALLTMLVSNQFVELKGNIFKKYGREQLEKIAGADAVERFNLIIYLSIIMIRNLSEVGWTWDRLEGLTWIFVSVGASEILVDWLKHAFLSRFNGFKWDVYDQMNTELARELLVGHALDSNTVSQQKRKFFDQPHLVTRKVGFVSLPIACLLVRVLVQSLPRPRWDKTSAYMILVCWLVLVALKLVINILILGRASILLSRSTVLGPFKKYGLSNSEIDNPRTSRSRPNSSNLSSAEPPLDNASLWSTAPRRWASTGGAEVSDPGFKKIPIPDSECGRIMLQPKVRFNSERERKSLTTAHRQCLQSLLSNPLPMTTPDDTEPSAKIITTRTDVPIFSDASSNSDPPVCKKVLRRFSLIDEIDLDHTATLHSGSGCEKGFQKSRGASSSDLATLISPVPIHMLSEFAVNKKLSR